MESYQRVWSLWLNIVEWTVYEDTNETQYQFQSRYARLYHFSSSNTN